MKILIVCLTIALLGYLLWESIRAKRDRKKLKHIIYVNGTRGKSSVTRMIDGGLRAAGYKVFGKTTGTDPMTINTAGEEALIHRHGRASIKEQLTVMHQAVKDGAEILVIECMAVQPEYQKISQHQMLKADIGVITNARLDHTDEMGHTVEAICRSLCNTVPVNGHIFTADSLHADIIKSYADKNGSEFHLSDSETLGELPDGMSLEFPENVALALAVCEQLGVDRETALTGIAGYKRDPYALSLHKLHGDLTVINGLSANDPQSTEAMWLDLKGRLDLSEKELVLVINNRPDRGYRMEHMIMLANKLKPREVWILGSFQDIMKRRLKGTLTETEVKCFKSPSDLPFDSKGAESVLFAVGNLANEGRTLIERIRKEGELYVP